MRPLKLDTRSKGVQGHTCVRRPERLPVSFGMRLVDGYGVRPQEFFLLCWGRRLGDRHGRRPRQFGPMSLR